MNPDLDEYFIILGCMGARDGHVFKELDIETMEDLADREEYSGESPISDSKATYCGVSDSVPGMSILTTQTRINSPQECNIMCQNFSGCEYWKWKNSKKAKKRMCKLMYQGNNYVPKWVGGEAYC